MEPEHGKVGLRVKEGATFAYTEDTQQHHEFHPAHRKHSPHERETLKQLTAIINRREQQKVIVTDIDVVLNIVLRMGKVRIDYVAEAMKRGEHQIEELARILEEHGMIEVVYPAFGKILLKKKEHSHDTHREQV